MLITPGKTQGQGESKPREVRLPGILRDGESIGLGDAIKRATGALGIRPCTPCQKRAEKLNKLVRFNG